VDRLVIGELAPIRAPRGPKSTQQRKAVAIHCRLASIPGSWSPELTQERFYRLAMADWAAASRAIGTRNGEQLT